MGRVLPPNLSLGSVPRSIRLLFRLAQNISFDLATLGFFAGLAADYLAALRTKFFR
ncbi:MAG: hypothetical protein QOI04_2363 [Verrucomicrobiota bacterium]|jgi:hypothetical protein